MTTLEIPVKRIVKAYFLHETNLDNKPVVNAKSEIGKIIAVQASFVATDRCETSIKERTRKEKLDILTLNVSFQINVFLLRMHHYYSIGDALEALFEREFYAFCVGRFLKSPSFHAAVNDFFFMYDLNEWDLNKDDFRRVMSRKYLERLEKLRKKNEEQRIDEVELEKKRYWR